MATVDSLPQPFKILGLVQATMAATSGVVPRARLLDLLETEAATMGADGVIGIRMSRLSLPGASRARLIGRVIDHYENTVVAVALGSAVRLLPATRCRIPERRTRPDL
jgi:uncharacterized protein YbjQ (UPF0145 family)